MTIIQRAYLRGREELVEEVGDARAAVYDGDVVQLRGG